MTPSQLALLVRSLARISDKSVRVSSLDLSDKNDLLGKTGMRGLRGKHPGIQAFGVVSVLAAGAAIAVLVHRLRQIDEDDENETYTEVDDNSIIKDFLKKFELDGSSEEPLPPKEIEENRDIAEEALKEYKDSKIAAKPPAPAEGSPERPKPAPVKPDPKSTVLSEMKSKFDALKSTMPSSIGSTQSTGGSLIGVGESRRVYIPGRDVMDAIKDASRLSGVPLALLLSVAEAESFFSTSVGAGTSSASGLYQFTTPTWNWIVGKYGKNPEMIERFGKKGITTDMKDNALAQAILGAYYMRDNLEGFRKAGYPTSSTEAYMNHFLGPGDAMKFMDNMKANPNSAAAPDFGDGKAKTPSGSNKNIFYTKDKEGKQIALSYAQVYEILKRKMSSQSLYQDLIEGKYGGLATDETIKSQYGDELGLKHIYKNKEGATFFGKAASVEKAREIKAARDAKKGAPKNSSSNSKTSVPAPKPSPSSGSAKPPPTSSKTAESSAPVRTAFAAPSNMIRSPSGALFYG